MYDLHVAISYLCGIYQFICAMPKRLTSTLYRSAVLLLMLFFFSQCGSRKATPRRPHIELPECSISDVAYSVPQLPGAEMRAVWLTTIFGLDWPKVSAAVSYTHLESDGGGDE